jgi:hypothetical protein
MAVTIETRLHQKSGSNCNTKNCEDDVVKDLTKIP